MIRRSIKIMLMSLIVLLMVTACSFSARNDEGINKSYIQPVQKLTADYTVGDFLYKDNRQYYIHENALVEYTPKPKLFSATTELNGKNQKFSFQWYEWNGEIKILNEIEIDSCT